MKSLFELAQQREAPTARSERADLIGQFVAEINAERELVGWTYKDTKTGKWKLLAPIRPRTVAVKVGHLKNNHDLHFFLDQCRRESREGTSFSKVFFGAIKVR